MQHTCVVRYLLGLLVIHATLLKAEWNTKDFLKREHSLTKPYQGSGFGVPNWDFQGSTMVTSNYIRLTPDQKSKQGALWNKIPCRVRNWEVQLNFKVTGTTRDLFGDGFAFWYTKERMEIGPVFGSKDFFSGLAIIGDTYSNHNTPNHQHPYLSAMVNNGSVSYDHDKDGKHTMLGGCQVQFRNMNHETWIAIRYENDKLTISHDMNNKRAWAPCFSTEGVKLPTGYYFGMSATTGDLSDAHDVISVKTYELDTAAGVPKEERPDIQPESEFIAAAPKEKKEESDRPSMSGIKTFLICLLVVLGIIVVGVIGIMIYQNQQENNRKRFY
eukprot:GFUD01113355.1.p1 GENE.GFUD01113355.1~~GFUD01113355.1.p1  ORF type:complete len:328 (+),score=74.62 GFUD01113355.1:49-1032(+)